MPLRALICFALVSGLGFSSAVAATAAAATADADMLKITLDQAKVAKVPAGTTTLVVGNPAIADVTMLKGGVGMVVTGKGYGQTNLVAIDVQGNILDEKQILVTPTRMHPSHTGSRALLPHYFVRQPRGKLWRRL